MAFFSAIASAVLPALARAFFDKEEKRPVVAPQVQTTRMDLRALRKEAERAGFNPLTVLRAGGGAGFTQTHVPVLSAPTVNAVRSGLVGGLASGLQAAFDFDPLEQETAKLENEIMKGQLKRLNVMNATRLGQAPTAAGTIGTVVAPERGETTVTAPGFNVDPRFVDAEAWEQRYGDIAQEFGGAINAGADLFLHGTRAFNEFVRLPFMRSSSKTVPGFAFTGS